MPEAMPDAPTMPVAYCSCYGNGEHTGELHAPHRIPHFETVEENVVVASALVERLPCTHRIQLESVEQVDVAVDVALIQSVSLLHT